MLSDLVKNKEKIFWTKHSQEKMRYYRLSEKKVLRILKKPQRIEEGIAPGTIAAMQKSGTKKRPKEIWIMYQLKPFRRKFKKNKIIIISAWRYPGETPTGQMPVLPTDVLEEIEKIVGSTFYPSLKFIFKKTKKMIK